MKKQLITMIAALQILLPQIGHSEEDQSHESIRDAVEQFVLEQTSHLDQESMELAISHVDPRIKLNQCDQPLEIFSVSKFNPSGKNNIGVKCNSSTPWKVYLSVTVKYFADVVVAATPLSRGAIINESDLVLNKKDLGRITGGYSTALHEVIGKEVIRPIRMGNVISPNSITNPKVIKKGQVITLKSGNSRISVTTSGKALSDGAVGDIIQILNEKSKRVIEGRVTGPGTVEINI